MRIVMTNNVDCLKFADFKEIFWREKLDETKLVTISLSVFQIKVSLLKNAKNLKKLLKFRGFF